MPLPRLDAELVPLREVDAGLVAAWRTLADGCLEPNPFFDPDMVLPAARWLPGAAGAVLLTVRDEVGLRLALPLQRRRGFRRLPVPVWTSWLHDHCYLGTPLVADRDPTGTWAAALELLAADGTGRWLALETMSADGPVGASLERAAREHGSAPSRYRETRRPVVWRRPAPTYLDGRLSSRRSKALRRTRRGLEAALGGEPVTSDRALDDLEGGLGDFLRLEASGWKGNAGTAIASRPGDVTFLRETWRAFARREAAHVWTLGAGGTAAAACCALRAGDTVFHVKTGFDDALSRSSPGVHLELGMVEAFHADPRLHLLDACTAGPSVSDVLYPDTRPLQAMALPLAGRAGRAAARGLPRLLQLQSAARAARSAAGSPGTA